MNRMYQCPVDMARGAARLAVALSLATAAACGGLAETGAPVAELEGDFVSVRKALSTAVGGAPVAGMPSADEDFYIAIKKNQLGSRWFLAAFVKQFYPDNAPLLQALGIDTGAQQLALLPLGTRVVSFAIQNDRLYMFDASDRYSQTALQDPTVILEAYPLVDSPEFNALPGSDEYVLFDPSQGLNPYHLTGETYADPFFEWSAFLRVGLAFAQNFRALPDGVAFDEVFSGDFDMGGDFGVVPAWGTLGLALRRYEEGSHYTPTPDPGTPFYFLNGRYAGDGSGALEATPIRWDFHRGREPVEVHVTAGADRAIEAYPSVDIRGAITRGIESWNDAFGFPVFKAVFTHEDRVPDDGTSFLLVDYPGPNGTAIGAAQINPNSGEIRAANIYLAHGVFDELDRLGLGASGAAQATADDPSAAAARLSISWSGMSPGAPPCDRLARVRGPGAASTAPSPSDAEALSGVPLPEQGMAWVQAFVAHEVGHTLGLSHNFKGSLLPPGGTTVMDYQGLRDSVALPVPGSYDIDAIRYLYQLSDELPTQPFCTDEHTAFDPMCGKYDEGAEPLGDFWTGPYMAQLDAALGEGGSVDALWFLNDVLSFARDDAFAGSVSPELRVTAARVALGRAAVPLAPGDQSDPAVVERANQVAGVVLHRAVLAPPEERGAIQANITDPGVLAFLIEQAGLLLRNADGVRSYAVRRTAADTLAGLQSEEAVVELRDARDAVAANFATGLPTPERQLTADLLSHIDAALDPYFR